MYNSGPKRAVLAAFFAGFFTNGSDIGYKIQQKNPPTPPILGAKAKLKTDPKAPDRKHFKTATKEEGEPCRAPLFVE
jgi:hypothetical protein